MLNKRGIAPLVIVIIVVAVVAGAAALFSKDVLFSPSSDDGDAPGSEGPSFQQRQAICGDGVCDVGETPKTCPYDCPVISPRQTQKGIIAFDSSFPTPGIIKYFDIATGEITSLPRTGGKPDIDDNYIIYSAANATIVLYDISNRRLIETGLNAMPGDIPLLDYPLFTYRMPLYIGPLGSRYELNYYDIETGTSAPTGIVSVGVPPAMPAAGPISGNYILHQGVSQGVGLAELYYYDINRGTSTFIADRVLFIPRLTFDIDGDIVVFVKYESAQGEPSIDYNGDGDFNDFIIHYYNINIGETVNTTVDITPTYFFGTNMKLGISGDNIVFGNSEGRLQQDLNGDGDMDDNIIGYHNIASGETHMYVAVGETPAIDKNIIAYMDWFSSNDSRIGYYNIDTGENYLIEERGVFDLSVYVPSNATYLRCISNTCREVQGSGINECDYIGQACGTTHLECINDACTLVNGTGANQCSPAGVYCGNQLPDLIVDSLSDVGRECGGGSNQTNITCSVTLQIIVKNRGYAPAGASYTRLVVIGIGLGARLGVLPTPSLAAGQQIALDHTFTNLSTGSYTADADADWYNFVQESNEFNNGRRITFTLP